MTSTIFQFIDREYRGTGKKITKMTQSLATITKNTKMTQSLANYYKKHENDAITGKLLQKTRK
jgi:lactam utilization protein B